MKFEILKKVWDQQNNESMFVINENTMQNIILRNKQTASKTIDKLEIFISIINSIVAVILFIKALNDTHYWNFAGSGMMIATVIYIQYFRQKRKKSENKFDRTLLGEIDHAISNTKHTIQFNWLMIVGYLLPFTIFYSVKMFATGASVEKWLFILGMYALSFLLLYLVQRKYYLPQKANLLHLRGLLEA